MRQYKRRHYADRPSAASTRADRRSTGDSRDIAAEGAAPLRDYVRDVAVTPVAPRRSSASRPAARPRADAPVLRLRERRAAQQRAARVPRRRGARAGHHRHPVPRPPGPARGAAGQAAGGRGQHARARRRRAHLGLGDLRPARPGRGEHRRTRQGLDPRRHAGGAHRHDLPGPAGSPSAGRSSTTCSTRCSPTRPGWAPAWTGRPACRSCPRSRRSVCPSTGSPSAGPTTRRRSTPSSASAASRRLRRAGAARRRPSSRRPSRPGRAIKRPRPEPTRPGGQPATLRTGGGRDR